MNKPLRMEETTTNAAELAFIRDMRWAFSHGVGYCWMLEVIGQEMQAATQASGGAVDG